MMLNESTSRPLILRLFHGRTNPDQKMDDWGSDGPVLHGVAGVYVTYQSHFRVDFTHELYCEEAKQLTGWEDWDENCLLMTFHDDMVMTDVSGVRMYYGDWELYVDR